METLKKIFSKKLEETGTLTGLGAIHKDVTLTVSPEGIVFKGYSAEPIPPTNVTDLVYENKALSFFIGEDRFTFEMQTIEAAKKVFEALSTVIVDTSIFNSNKIQYYIYNVETRKFDLHESPATMKILKDAAVSTDLKKPQVFFMKIFDDARLLHYEQIRTKTQYYLDTAHNSFVWSVYNDGAFYTFCIEFKDNVDFLDFCSKYVECCYKSVNAEDKFEYFRNISTMAIENEVNEAKETEDWLDYEETERLETDFNKDQCKNDRLVMGNNQVFVSRGSSLGVFDVTADDVVFRTQIQDTLNKPEKITSYNQDQNLLILDKDNKSELQLLDLNKGEVIEKWDVGTEMNDYFNGNKTNTQNTLVGLSDYSLFRIDPRSKEKVVERNEYKSKNEFSCGLSTDKGDVAVASKKGDLRLYNKIGVRAKSLLPGFGDEVLGIDSSRDGSLILCTCLNYILLYTVGSDYSKPVGKDKPTPKRLQLKPQHLSLIKEEIAFTQAKFDSDDSLIVTSTGRYVVRWKVSDVLAGNLYNYSIKALHDVIVDENFVVNGDDIVIALPDDVKKVTSEDLKKPN